MFIHFDFTVLDNEIDYSLECSDDADNESIMAVVSCLELLRQHLKTTRKTQLSIHVSPQPLTTLSGNALAERMRQALRTGQPQ